MTSQRKLHRRDFIKLSAASAGAAVAASAVAACGGLLRLSEPTTAPVEPSASPFEAAQPTPAPTSTPSPVPTPTALPAGRVVLVRTDDRVGGIRRAIDLLEAPSLHGKSLFVKPNFNSADPFPGSTHADTLLTLGQALEAMGADHLTVGDRSGMGDTRAVMRSKGVFSMQDELGWSPLVFDELAADAWSRLQPDSSHWRYGFALPEPVLSADGIVQTCCLKTHRFGGHFTLSLKNSVGLAARWIPGEGYDYMTELHNSAAQRRMIAEINTAYQPDLILMDAMQAFVDGGPDRGSVVTPGLILAALDRVALDAVGVAILRWYGTTPQVAHGPIFEQEQIARAVKLGLGVAGPSEIELITPDQASAEFASPIKDLLAAG
jgi:uncharacterized protein (DUF362 family)